MVTTSLSMVQKGKELWEKEKHIAVSVNCFFFMLSYIGSIQHGGALNTGFYKINSHPTCNPCLKQN